MKRLKRLLLTLAQVMILGGIAVGGDHQGSLAHGIQNYLNAAKGLEATFEQIDVNGERLTGTFKLYRPGRLRFDYDPPSGLRIIADGRWLVHYDGAQGEWTTLALSETPAAFLVGDPVNLADPLYQVSIQEEGETIALSLSKKDEAELGTLTLKFNRSPLTLKQWIVVDGQGLKTIVNLDHIQRRETMDPALFHMPPSVSLPTSE